MHSTQATTSKPSIKRDGTVTLDGQVIGSIFSRWERVAGRDMTRYTPYSANGDALSTPVAYRKIALATVLAAAATTQAD
jgi:hypothetical protein